MFKYPILAIFLCGVTWAGTCQAGFLGNDQDLQSLHNMINSGDMNTGNENTGNANSGAEGVDIRTQVNGPDNSQSDGPINIQSRAGDLSAIAQNVSVTQDVGYVVSNSANPVPEPGTYYLVALGLSVLGVIAYRRPQARTEALPGDDQS